MGMLHPVQYNTQVKQAVAAGRNAQAPDIPANALGLLATGGESYLLAAFPIYFTGGAWWVAYTAAGLALPLLAYAVWVRLKKAVRRG